MHPETSLLFRLSRAKVTRVSAQEVMRPLQPQALSSACATRRQAPRAARARRRRRLHRQRRTPRGPEGGKTWGGRPKWVVVDGMAVCVCARARNREIRIWSGPQRRRLRSARALPALHTTPHGTPKRREAARRSISVDGLCP
ncbi:hypothetical protein HPB50_012270 [Hyalomma asiaticum]|uniref:Uncharacterized protein n=1 Tax=Hyalomma asiaticum TaxID=266040 RepID=A0ACB7S9B6_HYAAI|nr:hypothetical protein HPB50_012270 [Hyalomma asiaticum]